MRPSRTVPALLTLLIFAFGLALYIFIVVQSSHYSINDHRLNLNIFTFALFAVLIFLLLGALWLAAAKAEARFFGEELALARQDNLLVLLPLSCFLLTPLLLRHYLTREDLRTRLILLAVYTILSVVYLKAIQWARHKATRPSLYRRLEAGLEAMPPRKKLAVLFFSAFLIYNACSFLLISGDIDFAGDEPAYLLTTHSLLKDKDINLANNYDQKDYFHFYDQKKNPGLKLVLRARRGFKGTEYAYPVNMPGISVLMLPYYWLSQLFKGKALAFILRGSLSVWAALLGLQLYLLALDLWKNRRTALGLWGVYSFTAPILFYAIHLYPEVPIALFSLYVFRKVTSSTRYPLGQYIFCAFLLALFPWFGLKYITLLWPLAIISAYYLLKLHKARWPACLLLALPLASQALFSYFTYRLYGTYSPFSIYVGVLTPERSQALRTAYLSYPLRLRIESFLDYFLDQRDGLLLYSPVYLFSFLGLIELFRRQKRDFFVLLFLILPYVANHAVFSQRQGYCPQGRNLAAVSWVGAILIGHFIVNNRHELFAFLFRAFRLLSFVSVGILLLYPSFLYQPTTHEVTSRPGDFFVFLSNLHFFLPPLLPSFVKIPNEGYLPNYIWVLAVVLFIIAYAVIRPRPKLSRAFRPVVAHVVLLAGIFLWVLYPRSVSYPITKVDYTSRMTIAYYLFPMGKGVVIKPSGQLYLHFEKSYQILFSSRVKLDHLKILFGSEKGEYDIGIRFFDLPIFSGRTSHENKQIEYSPPAYYPSKNLYLYDVNLDLRKLSEENMLINPFYLYIVPSSE